MKKYHPDNENGSVEITQEINAEYDRLFPILSKEERIDHQSSTYDKNEENEAFKEVINRIVNINADIEIIGSWIWVHGGYEYRELLKAVGFRFVPKKKCWCWHYGEYKRYHKAEVSLEDIRMKYGSQKVKNHTELESLLFPIHSCIIKTRVIDDLSDEKMQKRLWKEGSFEQGI